MVQAGIGGLDTPRTNLGDATYLTNQLDFDISQEQSFQSPSKDNNNLVQQLKSGRQGGINLRTPRSRVLNDRRNLPAALGGGEFTPLLKSATRNNALRNGKAAVGVVQTPGGLENVPEELSPVPMGSSIYADSRNGSYMAGTPMPQIDSSSAASTPTTLLPRRKEGPGVLQDGNQLSLREQENIIDKIEKENFGLKLKIHFLEEALRKAGPGFSEAALKENTELKVDKVTLQRELHQYRKTLTSAEREVESYRQQVLEMEEKVKRKHANESAQEELHRLRQQLEEKDAELERLRNDEAKFEDFQDQLHDMQAELREKNRIIDDREDEIDSLKFKAEEHAGAIEDLEEELKKAQRHNVELEEEVQSSEELEEAKETIKDLEHDLEKLKDELEDAKEDRQEAIKEKDRAEADLEELQEEMANKSITTKGLSRQIEEKANRLQDNLEDLKEKHATLENQYADKTLELNRIQQKMNDILHDSEQRQQRLKEELQSMRKDHDTAIRERQAAEAKIDTVKTELLQRTDEKDLLQSRHDALTSESASLQRELSSSQKLVDELKLKLENERSMAAVNDRQIRDEYKSEMDRLRDEVEDLRAEIREKERLYDNDSDKWDSEQRKLESERDRAEDKAAALQRTIDKLQAAEGALSGNEEKLKQALGSEKERHEAQEATLTRRIKELNNDLDARQKMLDEARTQLSDVREELRLSQRDQKSSAEKIQGLEDEIEILQNGMEAENEEIQKDFNIAKREAESLKKQVQTLKQELAKADSAATNAREDTSIQFNWKLDDLERQLTTIRQEKQNLQDQLANVNIELHKLRTSNAEIQAERDEIKSELKALKQQEEETYRLDQERIELRTTKAKLDNEVRRLRDGHKAAMEREGALEKELQQEIERASAAEDRLNSELYDLQRRLRSSSSDRELSSARKTIQQLEDRIHQLESQIESGGGYVEANTDVSILRRDLTSARQKETEYLQRELNQKELIRSLKRKVADLERQAHDLEISRLATQSPVSSSSGSARKSETIEVRQQLATAHQTLKDLRSQFKEVEREASRKVKAATLELQTRNEEWETEKFKIERDLEEARLNKDELSAKNAVSEATVKRLRDRIDRLEKALQSERLNNTEDRTMALERRDLHEMLRETQIQAESLELVLKEREGTITAITASEAELRNQLKRVREERSLQRSRAVSANAQIEELERKMKRAKDSWNAEKKALSRGVRFPNTSLSVNDESQIQSLKKESEEQERRHAKELRGLAMQIEWLRARCRREEGLRADAAYAKRFMLLQIDLFAACNKADLQLLQQMGITPDATFHERRRSLRSVAFMVMATVRMKKGVERWVKSRKIHEKLVSSLEVMKRRSKRSSSGVNA
ncbi:hypothetical protein B7463_g3805, partial [Scytalidium lignicola]